MAIVCSNSTMSSLGSFSIDSILNRPVSSNSRNSVRSLNIRNSNFHEQNVDLSQSNSSRNVSEVLTFSSPPILSRCNLPSTAAPKQSQTNNTCSDSYSWLKTNRFHPPKVSRSRKGSKKSKQHSSTEIFTNSLPFPSSESAAATDQHQGEVQLPGSVDCGKEVTTIVQNKVGRSPRIPFTKFQVHSLETKFQKARYLSSMDVVELSSALNLTEIRVKIWFQNRRARERREYAVDEQNPNDITDDQYQKCHENTSPNQQAQLLPPPTALVQRTYQMALHPLDQPSADDFPSPPTYSMQPQHESLPFQTNLAVLSPSPSHLLSGFQIWNNKNGLSPLSLTNNIYASTPQIAQNISYVPSIIRFPS